VNPEKLETYREALKTIARKCEESLDFLGPRIQPESTEPADLLAKCAAILSADSRNDAMMLLQHCGSLAMPDQHQEAILRQLKWRLDGAAYLATIVTDSSMLEQLGAYLEDQRSAAVSADCILRNTPNEDFGKLDKGLKALKNLHVLTDEPDYGSNESKD
jgi:hypothetical protein